MARLKNGINGPASGKVGSVVFVTVRGNCYARSLPKKSRKPRTTEQKKQNSKLKLLSPLLNGSGLEFIRMGFKEKAEERNISPAGAAKSYNMRNGFKGDPSALEINWEGIRFTDGDLAVPENVSVTGVAGGLSFAWDKAYDSNTGSNTDRTMIMLISKKRGSKIYTLSGARRTELQDFLPTPKAYKETMFEVYISFRDIVSGEVSKSVYCGVSSPL
jgi:hypothetical protein